MRADALIGQVLAGRYRVERVLGEGGMGVVLAAQHLMLGEPVAVKLLLPEAAKVPGVVPRFQREARAAATIQSEHVARVMDVGEFEDGTPYLVMEYLEGSDLAGELEKRGPLPVEEAIGYVLQAMVGVSAAHALGIVHRDLKPANLFLARLPNGRTLIKVLDFGIAKTTDAENANITSTFSALGSAAYMSPEQVRAAKSVDTRTDVWAFGVVLYELLTGRMPFDGESVTAVLAAIIADAPPAVATIRPEIPAPLAAAIMKCLEKDRERRTPSLAALAEELAPFGGRSGSVHAARIADLVRPTSEAPPAQSHPTSDAKVMPAPPKTVEASTTRPAWATSQGGSKASGGRSHLLLFGAAGLAIVAGGALIWSLSRRPDGDPQGSASAAVPAPQHPTHEIVTSPPTPIVAPAPAASAARADAPEREAPTVPSTPVAAKPSKRVEKKAAKREPGAKTRKKPLVTNL